MKTYNKLVRDNIPEIICKNGDTPQVRILGSTEYEMELNKKLQEEVNEYLTDGRVEELADIEEVLRALIEFKQISYEEFDNLRKEKRKQRGAFVNRVFLESVD